MKTKLFTLLFLMICGLSYGYDSYYDTQFYSPDYSTDMTVVVRVYLDDELQNTDRYEVGAYYGDEVRGFGMLMTDNYAWYYAIVRVYGEATGDELISFKLYDHQENVELDLITPITYILSADAEYGYPWIPVDMHFYQAGAMTFTNAVDNNWSTEGNWSPRIPTNADDAIIAANSICVIDEDATVAYKTLTIKDGAQFVGDGEEYEVTFEKEIAAYTPGTRNNYYFIANPTDGEFLETENLLEGNFDLYFFDSEGVDEETELETREWQNYVTYNADPEYWGPFASSDNGNGYLYANSQNTTLRFTGVANDASAYHTQFHTLAEKTSQDSIFLATLFHVM